MTNEYTIKIRSHEPPKIFIGGHKLQSAYALVDKLEYNANRADHKIENRIKDGGKKY